MDDSNYPNPNTLHPIAGYENEIYVKPAVKNPAIIVGDFTYIADSDFESHVTHLYDRNGDRLVIGKFCQIASGVEFVMNGANHQMNAVTTFPFYTLEGWNAAPPAKFDLPLKGDTVIGNDVWIGQNAVILPGVHIGDGAIIGANAVVGSDIPPYTIAVGNPARVIRKRFDDEMISLLEKFSWWDKPIEEIQHLILALTNRDIPRVKEVIRRIIDVSGKSESNLLIAIKERNFSEAKELILSGADCSARDKFGDSVLWNLSFQWNYGINTSKDEEIEMLELFKLVLDKGGNVNEVSSWFATPLIWATPDGIEEFFHDGKLLSLMLNYKPNIYLQSGGSFSCFNLATQNEEVLEILAEKDLLKSNEIPEWARAKVFPIIEKYAKIKKTKGESAHSDSDERGYRGGAGGDYAENGG